MGSFINFFDAVARAGLLLKANLSGAVFTGLITPAPAIGIKGISGGETIQAGSIGEIKSVTVPYTSPVSLTTATPADITSLPLTDGLWEIFAIGGVIGVAGTSTTTQQFWINTVSATRTLSNMASNSHAAHVFGATIKSVNVPMLTLNISGGGATVYLSTLTDFTVAACGGFGGLKAVRVG